SLLIFKYLLKLVESNSSRAGRWSKTGFAVVALLVRFELPVEDRVRFVNLHVAEATKAQRPFQHCETEQQADGRQGKVLQHALQAGKLHSKLKLLLVIPGLCGRRTVASDPVSGDASIKLAVQEIPSGEAGDQPDRRHHQIENQRQQRSRDDK